MSDLLGKQFVFSRLVSRLLDEAHRLGFEVKGLEWLRDPRIAALNAKSGAGIKNSLHIKSLAIDLALFKNGNYLISSDSYKELGEWWEKQSSGTIKCCWGGRFGDGGHFSIEHEGVK